MVTTALILITLFIVLYKFLTMNHDYWQKLGVPHKKPYPFFGTIFKVFIKKETYQACILRMYNESEGCRYFGIYNLMRPSLILRDLDLVTKALKSDFSYFSHRGLLADYQRDPLSLNVVFMDGQLWKRSRELLRPGFKSGRLRTLVPKIENVAKLIFGDGSEEKCFEVKQLSRKYASAIIFGPLFGLDLNEDTMDIVLHHCSESFNLRGWKALPVFMRLFVPKIALALGFKVVPKATEDFFKDVVERIKAGREDGIIRDDYIQTIMSSMNSLSMEYSKEGFLEAALCGQFFVFVVGGFETTSSTLCYSLHTLARHPDICEKARQELLKITESKKGEFTYDHLKEMKYLENIINEVLRMNPPIAGLYRVCTATYRIPDSNIVLKPGDSIIIPIWGIQNDKKYFTNPEEFRPSRFDEPIPEGAYLPFAYGPRICLGMRLAMMELKIILAHILLNYELSLDPRTPDKLEYDPDHLISIPAPNVWINFKPLK